MRSLAMAVSFLLGVVGAAQAVPGDYTIVRSFPTPMQSPDGVEWVDGSLWITECTSELLFRVEPERGEVQESLRMPGAVIDHLAWDGRYLWGNDHHDKQYIHQIDLETGEVVGGFETAWENPMGLAWDGEALWSLDPGGRKVHRLDPADGSITRTFEAPGGNTCGIGWDGVCLWVSDLTTGKYYQMDPETGEIVTVLNPPGGLDKLFTGFTWDGRYVWVDDENPSNPTLFQLDVELPSSGPCAQPADPDAPAEPDAAPPPSPDAAPAPAPDPEDAGAGVPEAPDGIEPDESAPTSPVRRAGSGEEAGGCQVAWGGGASVAFPLLAGVFLLLGGVALRRRRRRS